MLILLFILTISNSVFAQIKNDSLYKKLNAAKHDTIRVQLLIDEGDNLYYTYPEISFKYYNEALTLAKNINSTKYEAQCLLNIGYYYDNKDRFKESLEYYLKAIDLYKSINDEQGLANCYSYIGYSFSYLNSIDKALEYYQKALTIFNKLNDENGIADVYNGYGNLFYDIENYDEAYKFYLKAYEIYKRENDIEGLISIYINLGNAISSEENIDIGLEYYLKSIALCNEINDEEGLAINYTNIGDCYLLKGEYKVAEQYFNKALKLSKSINFESLLPLIYSNLASAKLKEHKLNEVINYVDKSLEASKGLALIYFEYDNYNYLSEAYEAQNDYKNALKYYQLYKKHTDSIFNAKKFEQVAKLSVLNKLETQDKQIELLTKKEEIRKLENRNQTRLIYILLIFSFFFLGLIYILNKQRAARKKAYDLLLIEKVKAEESDRLKSAFLANMSHEIRTPMNAILGFSGFLKDASLNEEKRNRFVDIINISGERLLAIINDIIDISKIESNQLKFEINKFDIKSTLLEIIEIQKKTNKLLIKKGLVLKLNKPEKALTYFLNTDQNRFIQILNNLINNAVKFTEYGEIEIGYSLKKYESNSYIEFYVKDTGCGIPKDKFDLIFDRFSQAGDGDFKQGNGLGLSICKGLIKLLNGEIWLESEENKGTTFYFTLPY